MDFDESQLLELFEERAAVREFCGKLARKEAEEAARIDVKRWVVELRIRNNGNVRTQPDGDLRLA
jgi:hypothetical protein